MKQTRSDYDVVFSTEIATIGLIFEDEKLIKLAYLKEQDSKTSDITSKVKQVETVKNKIIAYLSGEPGSKESAAKIQTIATRLNTTDFQRSVLEQLQKIPCGETRTYGDIAKQLKTSPRAVGNACRNNPLPIIIPCHRVLAASGLGGYDGAVSGKKLDIKSSLLKLEGVV
jgi:methylated-DNA-[protein]-cysteine S-methyltransferase